MGDLIPITRCKHGVDLTIRDCNLCKNNDEIERLTAINKQLTDDVSVLSPEVDRLQARVEELEGALYPIGKLGYDQTPRELGMSVKALHRIRVLAAKPSSVAAFSSNFSVSTVGVTATAHCTW